MSKRSEILVIVLGRAVNAALALVTLYALTHLLPPGEYALLALLISFQTLAGLILINPIGQWFTRHLHEWHDVGLLECMRMRLVKVWILASVVAGGLATLWFWLTQVREWMPSLMAGLTVSIVIYFQTSALNSSAIINALGLRSAAVLWQIALGAMGLLFSVVLTLKTPDALAWLAGQAAAAILISIRSNITLRRVSRSHAAKATGREALGFVAQGFWRYVIPLTVLTSSRWVFGNAYRFILERVWESAILGVFLLALSIPAQMTAILESIVMQYAYPYFFRRLAGETGKAIQGEATSAMTTMLLPLYWIWGAFLCVVAPHVIYLIASPNYHAAAQWAIVGALLEIGRLTGNAWNLAGQARKDFGPLMVPFALGAAGSLAASLITWRSNGSPLVFSIGLLVAVVVQSALVVIRARRMLMIRISAKRTLASGLLLMSGIVLGYVLRDERGYLVSIVILFSASLIYGGAAYLHLRTAHSFHSLLAQRLA